MNCNHEKKPIRGIRKYTTVTGEKRIYNYTYYVCWICRNNRMKENKKYKKMKYEQRSTIKEG